MSPLVEDNTVASWFALGLEIFLALWLLWMLATSPPTTKPIAPIVVPACVPVHRQEV